MQYLQFFEQGGSADIVSLISGGAEMTCIRALYSLCHSPQPPPLLGTAL